MRIELSGAGKRFNREWIFRKADLVFDSRSSYAVTGPNGSGKSTLLQCLGGMLQLSEGNIRYSNSNATIPGEKIYSAISFCAPYLDLIEEMNLSEFLHFHHQFKPYLPGISETNILEETGLQPAAGKQIRYYSSGMKQRVKLAQAVYFNTEIVLLDEPSSNLDEEGISFYHSLIERYCKDRLVVVCSNDLAEYKFCKEVISITSLKQNATPVRHR